MYVDPDCIRLYVEACKRATCTLPPTLTRAGRLMAAYMAQVLGVVDPAPALPQPVSATAPVALCESAAHVAAMARAG